MLSALIASHIRTQHDSSTIRAEAEIGHRDVGRRVTHRKLPPADAQLPGMLSLSSPFVLRSSQVHIKVDFFVPPPLCSIPGSAPAAQVPCPMTTLKVGPHHSVTQANRHHHRMVPCCYFIGCQQGRFLTSPEIRFHRELNPGAGCASTIEC